MELIGKWKVRKIFLISEDGIQLCTPEEIPAGKENDTYRQMCQMIFDFRPDGVVYQLMTPEQFAQLDTGEELRLLDGMAIVEEHPWKEEDGAFYYHTGMEGDIGGDPVDPYEKLEPDEDGCLSMMAGLLLIEKM